MLLNTRSSYNNTRFSSSHSTFKQTRLSILHSMHITKLKNYFTTFKAPQPKLTLSPYL